MINIHEPHISLKDRFEILRALSTNWIGYGDSVKHFERALSEYLSLQNIITATSGTQCLYEIFKLLKKRTSKREVIISPLSFVGIANAACEHGFKITYCDISLSHYSASYSSIKEKISDDTVAVVIQHYGGIPNYEISKISQLLKEKNIYLIEDCATVLGGKISGSHPGSFGDFSVWSFDCMKVITSLDGGALYCRHIEDLQEIQNSLYFGLVDMNSTLSKFNKNLYEWWILEPKTYGTKNVLNNVSAVLGLSQLKRIDSFIKRQKEIHEIYHKGIRNSQVSLIPHSPCNISESYFLFPIMLNNRTGLAHHLKKYGIFSTFRYYPLHKTLLHQSHSHDLQNAEYAYSHMLCIPCHKNLKNDEIKYIIKKINEF